MRSKGFTFLEILFVLMVISILVAIISPFMFGHLEEARRNKVKIDLERIVVVMINFQWDNHLLPRSNGTSPNDQSLGIMFWGRPDSLPQDNQWGDWKIEAIKKETHFLRRDLLRNHLMQNDPNNNNLYGDENDYRFAQNNWGHGWRGPYLDSPLIQQDPWGNAYMISYFKTPDDRLMGKIISAGPNKKLELKSFSLTDEPEIIQGSDDFVKYF